VGAGVGGGGEAAGPTPPGRQGKALRTLGGPQYKHSRSGGDGRFAGNGGLIQGPRFLSLKIAGRGPAQTPKTIQNGIQYLPNSIPGGRGRQGGPPYGKAEGEGGGGGTLAFPRTRHGEPRGRMRTASREAPRRWGDAALFASRT